MIISYITIVYCQNQEIDTGTVVFTKLLSYLDFTRLCVHVFYHTCRFMSPPLSEYRAPPSPQRTTLSPFSSCSLHPPVTPGNHWSVLYHDTLSFQECCINGIIDHFGFLFIKSCPHDKSFDIYNFTWCNIYDFGNEEWFPLHLLLVLRK